jgi:hypothetical protein
LFLVFLLSLLNHSSFSLVVGNIAIQTVKWWMRCQVLQYYLEVVNEQQTLHHAWRVLLLVMYLWRISDKAWHPSTEYH